MPEPTALTLTLTLSLHGDAFVASAQGHAVRLERRAAALCALAALEPGFPRERAAAWLWPDSADPRRNLRQQLLRFKQQFGQAVLAGEEQLMLAPGVVLTESCAPLLQAQRYDDCTEFMAWLEGQRAALNTRRAEAQRAVLAQAEAAKIGFSNALVLPEHPPPSSRTRTRVVVGRGTSPLNTDRSPKGCCS